MKKLSLLGLVVLVQAVFGRVNIAQAATIDVKVGDDLRAKIHGASSGDVVQVEAGTYTIGNEVIVPAGVTVTGAGAGETFITSNYGKERYMTVSAGSTVSGFTFTGRAIDCRNLPGKAVLVLGTLKDCRVTGFSQGAHFMNGAVYLNAADALVENCEIDNNKTGQDYSGLTPGGGVYIKTGTVRNCRIHHNEAHKGGGVYMEGGTLDSCVIYRNKIRNPNNNFMNASAANETGAGVGAKGGTIQNCIITANEALPIFGIGGLYVEGKTTYVTDTIVRGNIAVSSAAAGTPDFECTDADNEESKFSGCSLPIDYGTSCNTEPVLFKDAAADDYEVVTAFSVDKTSYLVGDIVTLEAAEAGDWTFTDEHGGTISETGKAQVARTFPAGVYDVAYEVGGVTYTSKSVFGVGATSYAVTTAAALEEAVALARDGSTITIADGTYALTKCIWLTNAVTIVGGGRDTCTLTGTFSDRMLAVANKDASVSGLTVSGGKLNLYGWSGKEVVCGAGVWINQRGGTITNCHLTGATAGWHYQMGAVAVSSADGLLTHCVIDNNDMSYGKTCWCSGLYVGAGLAENCLIVDNSKALKGGAVGVGASGLVRNCTIVDNTVMGDCAGACVVTKGGTFVNCLVGPNDGGTEWSGTASAFTSCAFVEADPPEDATSCLRVTNPYAGRSEGNYMILGGAGGPADHGADYEGVAAKDLGGNDRVQGAAIDIGCYEADAAQMTCQITVLKTSGFQGETFGFTASVVNPPAGAELAYAWTFDNGSEEPIVSNEAEPLITLGPGVYTINLTITAGAKQAVAPSQPNAVTVGVRELYAVSGSAGTFPYDEPGKGTSDIEALAALTLDGSTIHLSAGDFTLTEELILNKSVTLTGAGRIATCLHQSKAGVRVLTLNHADAVCENLSITDGKLTQRKDEGDCDSWGIAVKIGTNGGTVRNCRIFGNTQGNHYEYGAIAVLGDAGHVDRCLIDGNKNLQQKESGDGYGAGVYLKAGLVENCLITNNYAFTGGGAYLDGGTLRNCTIYKNDALISGGVYASKGLVLNCAFSGNTSSSVRDSNIGAPEWGNAASCFDTCAFDIKDKDKLPGETSFVVASPFENPEEGNLTPLPGEAGLADRAKDYEGASDQTDFLGNSRLSGKAVDVGAIELDANRFACSFSVDRTECFVGDTSSFTASVANPPAGATLAYQWTITDRFGTICESTEANPSLTLNAGWYTVALRVYDADNPATSVKAPTVKDYVHVAVRDSYATVGNANPVYPYDTAEKGATNIVELLDEAIAGTTIHIGAGVLTNVSEVIVTKGVVLKGAGWAASTLVAAPGQRVLTINNADATVEGLTLRGGRSTVRDGRGTGVLIGINGGTLQDCRVTDNLSRNYYQHGAVSVEGVNGLVDRCIIDGNDTTYTDQYSYGGGVYAYAGKVRNSLICGNTANLGGGVVLTGNSIAGNTTLLENCTIVGNRAVANSKGSTGEGGGICFINRSNEALVRYCVFWNNASAVEDHDGGFEWAIYGGSVPTLKKTAFPKRAIHAKTLGDDCIGFDDPYFADAANGNYRLTPESTDLRNVVRKNEVPWAAEDAKDLDGSDRIWGPRLDLGCYELRYGGTLLMLR